MSSIYSAICIRVCVALCMANRGRNAIARWSIQFWDTVVWMAGSQTKYSWKIFKMRHSVQSTTVLSYNSRFHFHLQLSYTTLALHFHLRLSYTSNQQWDSSSSWPDIRSILCTGCSLRLWWPLEAMFSSTIEPKTAFLTLLILVSGVRLFNTNMFLLRRSPLDLISYLQFQSFWEPFSNTW